MSDNLKPLTFSTIVAGMAIIFLMASVTYRVFGPIAGFDGPIGFQVMGIVVGIIIAHWVHSCIKDINALSNEDDDVQK